MTVYLDLQSTQDDDPLTLYFGKVAFILSPEGAWEGASRASFKKQQTAWYAKRANLLQAPITCGLAVRRDP